MLAQIPRAAGVVALGVGLVLACAVPRGATLPNADPRMLRATIGPGADRFHYEVFVDREVLIATEGAGRPDYIFAPTPGVVYLLWLAADRAVELVGPRGRRQPSESAPIPDALLRLTAPEDAAEVRARRVDVAARAGVRRAGWCEGAHEEPDRRCLTHPATQALVAEVRSRVLAAWTPPPSGYGGDRVIMRFSIAADGSLAERCVLGGTSPAFAQSTLDAFDAAFPIPAVGGWLTCLVGKPLETRFEVVTE